MGLRSRKPERVRREAMPVAMSIQWKPLRDSHYIVASLQPASGGRRQIFARQSALREIQALAHGDPEHPVIGLLLGERLDCALTGMPYLIVESHAEVALPSFDEQAMSDAIRTLRGRVGKSRSAGEVLGWYCIGPSVDAHVSQIHMAVHAACFAEPWQTVLILGADGDTGAFFLPDASAARWFHAPFSELTNSKAGSQAPKPTTVAWPAYLTTARVVPLAETPRVAPSPPTPRVQTPAQTWMATAGSPPSHQHPVAPLAHQDPVSVPARDPVASALPSVAVAPRRPALDLARIFGPIVAAWRNTTEKIVRIRSERAARAEQRKAHADAARAREEERRAKDAAERRAAREAAQRRAAEAAKQRAAEAERRRAAEAEARRAAEAEARLKAAAEAERRRVAEDEARLKTAQEAERRRVAEDEARRKAAEEAEQRRVAEEEERRQAAEAEAQRQLEEAEARRAAEAESQRKAAEEAALRAAEMQARREAAERAQREAEAEEQRRAAEAAAQREAAEAEARRLAAQAEAQRLAEEEAEARRQAAEAEAAAQQKAAEAEEEARRNAAAAEEEARRHAAEAEALRISVEVAALRERLARAPVEGSIREVSKVPTVQRGDLDDTAASDEPARYLSLARREGFEVSEEIERGSPEYPETFWLLYEREYGLRLIVVTTDEEVREASLHYNLRTDDDALLRSTPPEHRDLASRTIYGRETCLDKLRARCRRLRATGALQRDWKVSPALRHPDRASNGRAQSFSRAQDSLESTPPAPPLGG